MTMRLIVTAFPSNGPELKDQFPEYRIQSFKNTIIQKPIGLAFSGGGTRSASCTLGQLKAFHDTGLIDQVGYISAVSGGGWATTPYTYIDQDQLKTFFGRVEEPDSISWAALSKPEEGSLQAAIIRSTVLDKLFSAGLKGFGDESYAEVVGKIFLEPFGLHRTDTFFTYNEQTLQEAIKTNDNLAPESFVTCRPNAPYLILGATLLNHDNIISKHKYPVEYTPYYSGIRSQFVDEDLLTKDEFFGGGYISSYGYDCLGPYQVNIFEDKLLLNVKLAKRKMTEWSKESVFSLSDIAASTGAAPQEITDSLGLRNLGFPEFYHIPITVPEDKQRVAEEYSHSDGAHLENLGVMPLLARKLDRAFVFINTKCPFRPGNTIASTNINKSLKALFMPLSDAFSFNDFDDNIVFEGGETKFLEVIDGFAQRIDKEHCEYPAIDALFITTDLVTKHNRKYGVEAGHKITITWVYNQRSLDWESKLAEPKIAQTIDDEKESRHNKAKLDNFPHYRTFLENDKVIELSSIQTHLLVNHAYWVAKKAINSA